MPCALPIRSEEHTSELQSHDNLVCRLLLEKKKTQVYSAAETARGRTVVGGTDVAVGGASRARLARCGAGGLDALPRLASASFFFFNDAAPPDRCVLSLHDRLPI